MLQIMSFEMFPNFITLSLNKYTSIFEHNLNTGVECAYCLADEGEKAWKCLTLNVTGDIAHHATPATLPEQPGHE